ncbi:CGNR zinc finger domain-containing protein [Kribbella sp.]|uniref:CGNR zinc finger domain-containing protein n=1 Tax=Kribbella sp. TaxID=1871183 RepID=UPI002D756030|nr:CGNR zinc finger domain-containing protein [Kribbella sp.]HZX07078.1 CGNR zinc finger domain-containing protein [Kribbella sp.]
MEIQSPDRLIRLAVDLVNLQELPGPAELRAFLLEHGEPEPVEVGEGDLTGVLAVRESLRAVFEGDSAQGARVLNELLARYAVRPYLSDHDGTPWHVHVAEPGASWADWLAATTALGLATFAAGHGFEALAVCAATDCGQVFANTALNRPRRFCTPRCATRTRVATHRARQA